MHIQSTTTFAHGLHSTSLEEAIAAPQVRYQHCYPSFPFLSATNGGAFTGAGQSYRRDRCLHSVSRPPGNRHPRKLALQTDPSTRNQPAELYFHALGVRRRRHEALPEMARMCL